LTHELPAAGTMTALAFFVLFVAVSVGGPSKAAELAAAPASHTATGYVGSAACAGCHQAESEAWRGSHHDLAMAEATEETVLGDFDSAAFTYGDVTSRFFRRDGKFFVNTDGPDGELADFEIRYTFGVTPLQQYLIAFPDGRMQALGIAWDSRPKEKGGQRWFHLYPGQNLKAGDPLHWTGIDQTWNFQCAECHSTELRKNYDAATNTYATTWAEIDVACETCHGPGAAHVDWADGVRQGPAGFAQAVDEAPDDGFVGVVHAIGGGGVARNQGGLCRHVGDLVWQAHPQAASRDAVVSDLGVHVREYLSRLFWWCRSGGWFSSTIGDAGDADSGFPQGRSPSREPIRD